MVKKKINFMSLILIAFFTIFLVGCSDISGKGMADFGSSDADKEVLDHFKDIYGDITKSGEPRFLESMVTSNVIDNIPIDKVLKYSTDVDSFNVWFVYDNFAKNDALEIEWKYVTGDKVINTINTQATGDFGRGTFILEKTLDSWPIGEYTVTIKGKGVSEKVSFSVIDSDTISEALPWAEMETNTQSDQNLEAKSENSQTKPGWYLIESNDFTKKPKDNNYYRYEMDFKRGIVTRTTHGGKGEIFSVQTTWTQPPKYIPEEGDISIDVKKTGLDIKTKELGLKESTFVSIDDTDLGIGSKTAEGYSLSDPEKGDTIRITWEDVTGVKRSYSFEGKAPKEGSFDNKFGLRVTLYSGSTQVGTQYIYEWRD